MRKVTINIVRLIALALIVFGQYVFATSKAHADPFAYPCQYPGVGFGAEVFGVSGQFCDYPTEANGSHWHCESGGFRTGGIGLATGNGVSLGAISSLGASGDGCSFRCPDGMIAPTPNPPGDWKTYLVPRLNFCKDHAAPNGPTSAIVSIDEGKEPPPPGVVQPGEVPEQQPPDPGPPGLPEPLQPQGELPLPPLPGLPGIPTLPLP